MFDQSRNQSDAPVTFSVSLALTAHRSAQQFHRYHSSPAKARQVYLNTLAVYAVKFYLECLNIETDLIASSSWDPVQQVLLNTADLMIANRGKVECCPVLPDMTEMSIPADVRHGRLGYVAVQLSESLREANLLGYVGTHTIESVPAAIALHQLDPLDSFAAYLCSLEMAASTPPPVRLSRWLQGAAEAGWQAVDGLVDMVTERPQLALDFRNNPPPDEFRDEAAAPVVVRQKKLSIGASSAPAQVTLWIGLRPLPDQEVDVYVQVTPREQEARLPSRLTLVILDDDGVGVMKAQARGTEAIQLRFGVVPDERFSVRLALESASVTEIFMA
ncbi:MAG: DUF1822 family protein [Elainellaceae cyanobacterium]